jgi:hypothetical protein
MADVAVVVGAPAPDGRGMCTLSDPIADLPEEFVWERLVHKVRPLLLNLELPEGSSARIEQGFGLFAIDVVDKLQYCPENTVIVERQRPIAGTLRFFNPSPVTSPCHCSAGRDTASNALALQALRSSWTLVGCSAVPGNHGQLAAESSVMVSPITEDSA